MTTRPKSMFVEIPWTDVDEGEEVWVECPGTNLVNGPHEVVNKEKRLLDSNKKPTKKIYWPIGPSFNRTYNVGDRIVHVNGRTGKIIGYEHMEKGLYFLVEASSAAGGLYKLWPEGDVWGPYDELEESKCLS